MLLFRFIKKKKKQSVGRSASLFDFRFIKKRKEKKQREQVKVIFKYIALVLQSQYGSDSLSPWLYLFQLNNIKIILKNHEVKYLNFIWSSYYWIISGLSFHCYTSLKMQPKNFLNSSYGDKNEFKQERIKLSLGWSSGWKNILSPTAKKIDKSKVADFKNARNFHVKFSLYSLWPKEKTAIINSLFIDQHSLLDEALHSVIFLFFSLVNLESKGTSVPLQLFH